MKKFVEDELGLEFKFDSLINPRIDCSQAPLGVRLSPEEVVALDLYWPNVAIEHRKSLERALKSAPGDANNVYSCGGGIKSFAIDPYGNMSICVLSQQDTYSVRSGSLREGWEQFLLRVRQRERRQISKCVDCHIKSVCGMCPANGELENGDAESPVEFLCEVAHLRALALGFEIPDHGDCAFCRDANLRIALTESAERIASQQTDPGAWIVPQSLLPVLNNSIASGCSGCGSHH
jgi:radical SAM protein with 4Fe4S-binding SPASM domain